MTALDEPPDSSPDKPQSWTTSPPALRARPELLTALDTGEHTGVGDHVPVGVDTHRPKGNALPGAPLGDVEPCAPARADGETAPRRTHDVVPDRMEGGEIGLWD